MEAPDFWDDAEVSQQKMKELKSMKDDMETYHNLETQLEDMETMIEMGYEENDPEIIPEIQEMLDEFQKDFDSIRVKTLLSGEYDSENAIIKLNAGAGGTEACDWCGMLYRMYSRWVDRKGFSMEVLDYLDGDEAGVKSVTFQHRAGITPYTSTFVFAECCVFNKQLQPAGIFDRFNLRPLGTTIYAGAPSPEVTVLFCLVPSPEFSQAPEYSLPDHLCRFSVRFR